MSEIGSSQSLRILQVEDSRDDAELTSLELQYAGIRAVCHRVDNEQDLLRALTEFRPDLVLSDMHLPGFSGTRALALVREHSPTLPFVFFTGARQADSGEVPLQVPETTWLCKEDGRRLPALVQSLAGLPSRTEQT